mgnify:FL=1
MKKVERGEFRKFIRANKPLEGKPVSTNTRPGLSAMQYVNGDNVVMAQAVYWGKMATYEIRD